MCTCSPPCRPAPTPRRAFTLVEILSVLGVISLLVAMLFPALSSAREHANRTRCLSNLRQLGLAFAMYLNENNGRFPRPAQHLVERPEDWIYYQPGRDAELGVVARYASRPFDQRLYRCPSDDVASHLSSASTNPLGGPALRYDYSYTVNEYICRLWPKQTLRINQVRNPSEKILIVDESAGTIDDGCWAWQPDQGQDRNVLSNRHDRKAEEPKVHDSGRGNVAFADGHAEYIAREQSFERRHYDPTMR
jgi:prepilin-type processing-associated H-X9-DG protein